MIRRWGPRLLRYARPHLRAIVSVLLLTLWVVAFEAAKPWPLKLAVDSVLVDEPLPGFAMWLGALPGDGSQAALLVWLSLATVVIFVAEWSGRMLRTYLQTGLGQRLAYEVGADLFDHLQALSLRFHGRKPAGDLARRVTRDSRFIQELVVDVGIPSLTSVLSLVTMWAVMWQMDPALSLAALGVVPFLAVSMRVFSRPMEERSYLQYQREGDVSAQAERALSALPAVQAFGRERLESERFDALCGVAARAQLRAVDAQIVFGLSTTSITALGTAAVTVVGGLHVLDGGLSVGELLVFLAYLASLYGPLETLAYTSSGFASAAAGARRVAELLDEDERVQERPGARPLPRSSGGARVRFENVVFGYEPGRPVLEGVDLDVRPGETLAIVGPTGAGKSSLVSLVPRLFDPWSGSVSIDGCDLRGARLADVRDSVAVALQEPYLLPLSVAENIAYGRRGASRAEVEAAARSARAHEFILALPEGYDTVLGELGATLSGGERQRLSIARAYLKDAPVLILDEPTSALDAETEAALLEAFRKLARDRTTFVIAHRLSTVRRADRIAVMEGGRVVELGSHDELMQRGGLYARLQRLQHHAPPEARP